MDDRRVQRGEADQCWPWAGGRNGKGYGMLKRGGVKVYAHRVAWAEAHGAPIPVGMVIMHTCDNPPCCNPAHLVLGTYSENNRDMYGKGRGGYRGSPGARNGRARLSAEQVTAIRAEYAAGGVSQRALAERYGIAQSHVSRITHGAAWA